MLIPNIGGPNLRICVYGKVARLRFYFIFLWLSVNSLFPEPLTIHLVSVRRLMDYNFDVVHQNHLLIASNAFGKLNAKYNSVCGTQALDRISKRKTFRNSKTTS